MITTSLVLHSLKVTQNLVHGSNESNPFYEKKGYYILFPFLNVGFVQIPSFFEPILPECHQLLGSQLCAEDPSVAATAISAMGNLLFLLFCVNSANIP